MRYYIVLFFCGVLIFSSCSSSKKVVNSRKVVVVEPEEKIPDIPQLKQHNKKRKTTTNHTVAYIEKFAPIAVKKMLEYNIPASITLAQGVLESGSGRSPLAIRSNNHFGIKCHKGWTGERVYHDDDELQECFRKYKDPKYSYRDHSLFLTQRSRYENLLIAKPTDNDIRYTIG